uniref:Cell wall glycosyl hydrolase YteR n=1 Tax=Pyricularia oryzae (strain P131) TaxID=1143193 RepID=L7JRA0_PYRO1
MKTIYLAALVLGLASASPQSNLARMADTFIRIGVRKVFYYNEATLYTAFEAAYNLTGNSTLVSWYRDQIDDAVVLPDGTIRDWRLDYYSLDDYRIGNNLLWWYQRTGDAKYRAAADTIRRQLDRHPRTPSGGFWHRAPVYEDQMWLDGIFMADSFYARWTALFDGGNATAWDDIARQFDNIESRTRNQTTGLLVHGYDEAKRAVWADPVTGAAPLVWGRAVGWYFLALTEVIPLMPAAHPGRGRLVRYFVTLAEGLKKAQDRGSGGWWLVMSEPYPGRDGNYLESSAAAMFTAGLLRGMKLGLLETNKFRCTADKAYQDLVERFVTEGEDGTITWEGTVQVGSLSGNGTYEWFTFSQYYISIPVVRNDARGGGAFMLASYEMATLK